MSFVKVKMTTTAVNIGIIGKEVTNHRGSSSVYSDLTIEKYDSKSSSRTGIFFVLCCMVKSLNWFLLHIKQLCITYSEMEVLSLYE